MSEDEIYNYLISFISSKIKQHKLILQDMAGFNLGYLSTEELQKAIQGLMNLYKAEKEKNRDLQIFVDDVKEGVYIDYPEFEEKYISKDKIKEKIKEYNIPILDVLDKLPIPRNIEVGIGAKDGIIYVLHELLEEGE